MGWSEPAATAGATPTRTSTPRRCPAGHTSKRVGQFGKPRARAPACRCFRGTAGRAKPSCPHTGTRCSRRGRGERQCASAAMCSSMSAGGTLAGLGGVLRRCHRRRGSGCRRKTEEPQARGSPAPSAGPGQGREPAVPAGLGPARRSGCGAARPGACQRWCGLLQHLDLSESETRNQQSGVPLSPAPVCQRRSAAPPGPSQGSSCPGRDGTQPLTPSRLGTSI